MNNNFLLAVAACAALLSGAAGATCQPGAYGTSDGDFVVVVSLPNIPPPGQRYLFRDGRRGSTADTNAPVTCQDGGVSVAADNGRRERWPLISMTETDGDFLSVGTRMAGQLIEPVLPDGTRPPLVIMVHGSERSAAIGNPYAYAFAAQGISVFVYDKRGTGDSGGEYTQNFELLAEDASAALAYASRIAQGRFDKVGYFGGSQGGWVAPLAASRSPADFIAVGFGLVTSPIGEDREQMISEVRALGLDEDAIARVDELSKATATLLLSEFREGYDALAGVRKTLDSAPWLAVINGEYSGDMLRLDENVLRRVGRARFDNLELIWDYDAEAVLEALDTPLLWVLAGDDREAPIEKTRASLMRLVRAGKPIRLYVFPDTDHGMFEFIENEDGSRTATRITDGYFRLVADWIKGHTKEPYGRAKRLGE